MANQILIKRTATPAKVPATTDMALGELTVNTFDGKLFLKKNNGAESVVEIGAGGGGGGSAPVNGSAEVDFGSSPRDQARITVLNATITSSSMIILTMNSSVHTVDHSEEEHQIEEIKLDSGALVPGVSFDIVATCSDKFGLTGKWAVRWAILG